MEILTPVFYIISVMATSAIVLGVVFLTFVTISSFVGTLSIEVLSHHQRRLIVFLSLAGLGCLFGGTGIWKLLLLNDNVKIHCLSLGYHIPFLMAVLGFIAIVVGCVTIVADTLCSLVTLISLATVSHMQKVIAVRYILWGVILSIGGSLLLGLATI